MDLLTVQEVARMLKVNPITVRRYIADGRLPAVKVGKSIRVRREAIAEFVKPVEPGAPNDNRRGPASRPLTYDDPLWQLVGSVTDAEPTDASKKYEYLADAIAPQKP